MEGEEKAPPLAGARLPPLRLEPREIRLDALGLWDSISRQLSEPTGLGGRLIAAVMNRGNAGINEGALERLEVLPGQRVLEVGFGGGATLGTLLEHRAKVSGLDRAGDMVTAARRAYAAAIASG